MPRKPMPKFKLKNLTKGELRKLNALRKSLGSDIADAAFSQWYVRKAPGVIDGDKNAAAIETALMPLIKRKKLQIPRGGYVLRRGRGRVIVERPS